MLASWRQRHIVQARDVATASGAGAAAGMVKIPSLGSQAQIEIGKRQTSGNYPKLCIRIPNQALSYHNPGLAVEPPAGVLRRDSDATRAPDKIGSKFRHFLT
jgi:hypothetical protein